MGKLGYSSLTLTDITETIPISLALQSNLDQGVQIKNGDLYSPDFTKGEGLIITPSLFLGSQKIDVPVKGEKGVIFYQITGEINDEGTEKNFSYSNSTSTDSIYVDEEGKLHYNKNLNEAITIEAYILNYKNIAHDYIIESVSALNPITILFLEQVDQENYSIIISTTDGREYFDENHTDNIQLTATLYKGIEEVVDASYEWDTISDTDDGSENDFTSTEKTIEIKRSMVSNVEAFQCTVTDNITGISYFAQKIIRDFTDGYTNQLIANGTLILTPQNTSVSLENQVWHQTKIINGEETDQSRFVYTWKLLTQDMEETDIISSGNPKILTIDLMQEPFNNLKENFSILGSVIIDGKAFTANYIDIKYQPVSYSVDVSPRQIFIPTSSEGKLQIDSFSADFTFKLLDENKQVLDYIEEGSNFGENEYYSFSQTSNKWEFNATLTIDKDDAFFSSTETSKNITVPYQYLNNNFTETIQLIKNYAGADGAKGADGTPSYNFYLSNDYYLFAGGETAAKPNQSANFNIYAFFGAEELEIAQIEIGNMETPITNFEENISEMDIGITGLKLSYSSTTETYSLVSQGEGNFLTSSGTVPIKVTAGTPAKTILLSFNYAINYNGNSYSLIVSENQIVYLLAQYKFNLSQVVANAYCQENGTGNNIAFVGYLTYAIDGKNESSPINGSSLTFNTINLNASNSYVKFSLYKDNEKSVILDTQTVPILTSYEGLEVGGENLLKWTKAFIQSTTKWHPLNDSISFGSDGDFITLECESGTEIQSPKIAMDKNYSTRTFCLSGLVKIEDITEEGSLSFYLYGCNSVETASRTYYSTIGQIKSDNKDTMKCDDTWEGEKWLRIYQVFNFSSLENWKSDESEISSSIDFSICPYFGVGISSSGDFSIKQLKLELGNIPTSWSASPYDITYDEIVGTNLIEVSGLSFEVKTTDPYKTICGTLQLNKTYTLSFSSSSNNFPTSENETFLCEVICNTDNEVKIQKMLSNNSQTLQSWTFTITDSEENARYSLRIYAYNSTEVITNEYTLTLTKLKLETGNEPTSFFVNDEYFDNLINNLQQQTNNTSNELITYKDENGKTISALAEDIKEINGKSYITTDEAKGLISVETNNFYQNDEYLQQLKGSIELSTTDSTNPYVKIATKAEDTNIYTKITKDELGFYDGDDINAVAKITNQAITIGSAYFTNNFHIGSLLVTVDESGVGFTWDNSK